MALSKINGTQHCMSKFVREQRKDFSNEIAQEEVEEILCYMLNKDSFTRQKCLIAQKKIQSLCCKSKEFVIEILESHAKKLCQYCCEQMVNGCSEEILNIYVSTWTLYDKFSRNVKTMFSPINKQIELESLVDYCNPSRKLEVEPSLALYNFMLRNWSVVIKESKDFLSDGFFASIEKYRERNGKIDNNILKKLHDSFDKFGLSNEDDGVDEFYRMEIEQPILRKLEAYYERESKKYFLFLSDDDAIAKCSEILEQEKKILEKFLPRSAALINKRAWEIYVSDNINRFIERAKYYIEHEEFERFKIAYTCLMMSEDIYNKIQEREEKIFINLRETCETTKFCECFLKTYAQEHQLLRAIFGSKSSFDALDEGVSRAFCNNLEYGGVRSKTSKIVCVLRVSEILVNDIDLFMRSETNELLIAKIEKKMEDVMFILNYIEDKSKFNELYSARLAHRLFNSLIKSEEAEQNMIDEISLSLSQLENAYLKEVKQFYTQKSLEFVDALDVKDYVEKCLWLLEEESESKTFLPTSQDKILSVIRQILVFDNLDFINSHCRTIIEDQNVKALNNAYKLLHFDSKAIFHMLNEYQDHIEKKIEDAFKIDDVGLFVDSLAGLHADQSKLIANNFSSDRGFFQSLDKGFRNAINRFSHGIESSHQMSSSEILVTQCNNLLNDEKKGLNEIDGKLAGIITLFKYIEDKDVFNTLYSKALAMRLLHASSLSMEAEELMINKLKQESGYRFVRLLEKMVTDYHLSKDNTSKFNNGINLPISFSISIMQTGSWPIQACKLSPVIPQKLSQVMTKFNRFYKKNYSGRKLHWHHVLSSCDVKLNYLSKTCIVHTSVVMTTILTIFNNVESATFNEIKSSTEIDAKDLVKHLQFLATHKILLNGDGINPKVTEESTLSLNYKYVSKKARIRLMPVLKEAKQETKETTRAVLEDRKYYLQALIVRIMKAKKKSTHSDLVNEVIQESMSNFVPTQVFIKNVIDCLIEKEYLTRVDGKSDMYHYLA